MIRKSLSATTRESTFDYTAYKKQVVIDDCNELEKFIQTTRWWWWLPVFGFIFYTAAVQIALSGIDRGTLRKEITKRIVNWSLIGFLIIPVIIIYVSFAINIYQLIMKKIIKISIVVSRQMVSENQNPSQDAPVE